MQSMTSRGLTSLCLPALALTLSACAGASVIPDSLKAECESTVGDISEATTVAHLGQAIIRGDGDLRVCSIRKDAVVAIAEAQRRPWWQIF